MASILIVEDERVTALFLQKILTSLGHYVVAAVGSGEAALEALQDRSVDLALVDIGLEGQVDGLELVGLLHQRFGIPSMVLSGHTDKAQFEKAQAAGALGYLVKPYDTSQLQAAIQFALAQAGRGLTRSPAAAAYRWALEAAGVRFCEVGPDQTLAFVTGAFARWLGLDADDLSGRPALEIVPDYAPPHAGTIESRELRFVRANGRTAWFAASMITLPGGGSMIIVADEPEYSGSWTKNQLHLG